MSPNAAKLQELVDQYKTDEEKFLAGNNSAGTRARGTLMAIKKLCDSTRKEIQESKNAEKSAD